MWFLRGLMLVMQPAPLVEEAAKKAAVAWLLVPGAEPAYLVWTAWLGGALLVVSGPGEQSAPGLAGTERVLVSLRGDHGGRIVTWPARVSTVDADSSAWAELVPQLAAKRLNGSGTAEEMALRWAESCTVSRLEPSGAPEPPPDGSLAAPPRPTTATRRPRRPFRLHRVRRG
jgi:hypothetical protein